MPALVSACDCEGMYSEWRLQGITIFNSHYAASALLSLPVPKRWYGSDQFLQAMTCVSYP
jgi:hypothetical protein